MADPQLRLLPAARPLADRLGAEWFRALPSGPGVYRMHDAGGEVVYVGKAVDLRRRLSSYRRTHGQPRRIVRLIHAVECIDWESAESGEAALRREAELIRALQPRFNRAGRWSAPPLRVRWTCTGGILRMECVEAADGTAAGPGESGPFRAGVRRVVMSLARLLWLAARPHEPVTAVPHGLSGRGLGGVEVALPAGPHWERRVAEYLALGRLALAWELADLLEGRVSAFEARYVRAQWEAVAEFARRHPAAVPAAG